MSSRPDKLLLNESRTSPSAAGFIGTIEGHLLISGAVIHSLPARADREQCMILGRGGPLSTLEPAHGRCRSPIAAVFGSRSQPAPRRVFAAVTTSMVEKFVYSFVWVLVGRVRLPGPKMSKCSVAQMDHVGMILRQF